MLKWRTENILGVRCMEFHYRLYAVYGEFVLRFATFAKLTVRDRNSWTFRNPAFLNVLSSDVDSNTPLLPCEILYSWSSVRVGVFKNHALAGHEILLNRIHVSLLQKDDVPYQSSESSNRAENESSNHRL